MMKKWKGWEILTCFLIVTSALWFNNSFTAIVLAEVTVWCKGVSKFYIYAIYTCSLFQYIFPTILINAPIYKLFLVTIYL